MSVTVKSNVSDVKTLKLKKGRLFIEVTAGVEKDKPAQKKSRATLDPAYGRQVRSGRAAKRKPGVTATRKKK